MDSPKSVPARIRIGACKMSENIKYIKAARELYKVKGFPFTNRDGEAVDFVKAAYDRLSPEEKQECDEWNRAEMLAAQDAHNKEQS